MLSSWETDVTSVPHPTIVIGWCVCSQCKSSEKSTLIGKKIKRQRGISVLCENIHGQSATGKILLIWVNYSYEIWRVKSLKHTHTHVWVIDRPRHWHHMALTFCLCHLPGHQNPCRHTSFTHTAAAGLRASVLTKTRFFPVGLNSFCCGGWIPNSGSIKAADTTRTKLRDTRALLKRS